MKSKKRYILFFCIIALFLISHTVFANNENTEEVNIDNIQKELVETYSDISKQPKKNSRAAIILDRKSKTILYGKNEKEKRKMASTTKIMTAPIVLENSNINDIVEVSKKSAGTGGSRLGLKTGDKITVHDLLYGLMLCSGNDAAVALAEHVGGSIEGFADLMNKKAQELNLLNTHFVTPHGLDNDDHYTTAYELAILTDYALKNKVFAQIVNTKNYTVTINGNSKNLSNTNELLGTLNGVYGVKTGFTNGANRCLVTACKKNDLDIICIVLGADTKKFRTQDSIKLIEYTFNNYQNINIKKIIDSKFENWKLKNLSKFTIKKGISNKIELSLSNIENEIIPIRNNEVNAINIEINCNKELEAPIKENKKIGELIVNINNKKVINLDITNTINIKKKNPLNYFKYISFNYIAYLENIFQKQFINT